MPRLFDLLGRMSVQGDCGRVGGEVTSPFFFSPLKRGLVRRARRSGAQSRFFTPERHSALLHVLLQTLYILMWRYSKTYGDVISSGGSLGYARDKFCREKSRSWRFLASLEMTRWQDLPIIRHRILRKFTGICIIEFVSVRMLFYGRSQFDGHYHRAEN